MFTSLDKDWGQASEVALFESRLELRLIQIWDILFITKFCIVKVIENIALRYWIKILIILITEISLLS